MNLHKLIFTENECYKTNVKDGIDMKPQGLFLHSTGANNPYVKRYVGPDDGYCGTNPYNNHWNQPMDRRICVHGFIGKADNGEICSYQTLPWNFIGWHSGSGSRGSANKMGFLGFEICEDGLENATYFNAVYKEAVELFGYLANEFNIKPEKPYIICHCEGHALGIASNHADVMHWFKKHNKTMDDFRNDVAAEIKRLKGIEDNPEEKHELVVGDIVTFLGGNVYTNANASTAATTAKAGPAKVERTYNGKHPYLLKHTDKQSTVYGWVDANSIKELQVENEPEVQPEPKPEITKDTFAIGEIVYFKGGSHYSNANANKAASTKCTAGAAKVDAKYTKGKHPYLLIAVRGQGSNVYGWVDCDSIDYMPQEKPVSIKVGDKVRVNAGAKTFTGGGLSSNVYKNVYDVLSINEETGRTVIGIGTQVTAAVRKEDLVKA